MHRYIDDFQDKLRSYFNQMLLGSAFVQLGQFFKNPSEVTLTVKVAKDVTKEPRPLSDILHHASEVAAGTTELYQVRAIAAWNDLLTNIFSSYVAAHLTGQKQYPILGRAKGSIDFASNESVLEQIQKSVITDFSFLSYEKRINIIRKLCKTSPSSADQLKIIVKNVEIRNSLQHHDGRVTKELLKNIGNSKLELKNPEGERITFGEAERILLSIPDLNELHSALYRITTRWRYDNADIPA